MSTIPPSAFLTLFFFLPPGVTLPEQTAEQTQSRMNLRTGGKVKGCKIAKRGKGRAYGKNS